MRAEITDLQRRLQTTTVYVTHDQVEAMTMGHRIAVLDGGELQQVGTPRELYETAANLFVARSIGTPPMNLIRVQITADGTRVKGAGLDLELSAAQREATSGMDGREVMVGVRPEHVHDDRRQVSGPTATVRVTVELVETLGHEVLLHGRLGDHALAAKVDPRERFAIADEVDLYLDLNRLHLFDAATERRLIRGE
jgi:multiple sugar transport system ATP-binding protein